MMKAELSTEQLNTLVMGALEDLKAVDPVMLDVRGRTSITDLMFVASGNSNRHVKAIADNVLDAVKEAGLRPLGVEGESGSEWVLVDLGDAVVHVMLPQTRDTYRLEDVWSLEAEAEGIA
ncbi:ribosome silencing factor [Alkalilimnicola sp. S0819]|uniref:ribosome silencing factor n=1 Tax=Alkalilimnicola sp. S0819 TaxID=2613922 RepID=UPI001D032E13|nr:ribosome silencing factor [Alkalilimnicola sp. S0819]